MQTTMLKIYFIIPSVGLGLYLIEYVQLMKPVVGIAVYIMTVVWIAFNWFYLRAKVIKKQNDKINEPITKFQNINNQIL